MAEIHRYIKALGWEVKRGRPPIGPTPSKSDLVKFYIKKGYAIRDIAAKLGCTKNAVYRGLKKYGIETRPPAKRSGLRTIPLEDLRAAVQEKGFSEAARDLGVDRGTLRYYIRKASLRRLKGKSKPYRNDRINRVK